VTGTSAAGLLIICAVIVLGLATWLVLVFKADLLKRAREVGIKGRSSMSKSDLIKALRDH
jgi:Rho termination factor, N-terminal domain